MKYTITINQSAIFTNGLINKTDAVDWVIIDYLKDFSIYKKAKKIAYQNEEYIWLNYNHLIASLPLTKLRYKPKVTKRINKLRNLGLIKTVKSKDNTLYYTFTEKLIDVCFAKSPDLERLKRNARSVTEKETPPVTKSVTPPVTKTVTAQYKTKNTIINKDNNNDISFSSSLSKNKELKQVKPIKGFNTFNGSIWNILDNIRQRQLITTKARNKENTKENSGFSFVPSYPSCLRGK